MGVEKLSGAMDFAYLEGFAAGDTALVAELLTLFQGQCETWAAQLAQPPANWRDIVHTIKGTSRGVGAFALGDACAAAEAAGDSALPAVVERLHDAMADIAAYEARTR